MLLGVTLVLIVMLWLMLSGIVHINLGLIHFRSDSSLFQAKPAVLSASRHRQE